MNEITPEKPFPKLNPYPLAPAITAMVKCNISIGVIFGAVEEKFGMSQAEIIGLGRTRKEGLIRFITIALLIKYRGLNYNEISCILQRHESSIKQMVDVFTYKIRYFPEYNRGLDELDNRFSILLTRKHIDLYKRMENEHG